MIYTATDGELQDMRRWLKKNLPIVIPQLGFTTGRLSKRESNVIGRRRN